MAELEGLQFEKPILVLQDQIDKLKELDRQGDGGLQPQIRQLERRLLQITGRIFERLNSWELVQVSRHPRRPHAMDYIRAMTTEFTEIHGDRLYRDDKAIVARARRIQNFLSQPFFVASQFTGREGRYVPIRETVRSFRMILNGELDHIPEQMFYMAGGIDEVIERYEQAQAED